MKKLLSFAIAAFFLANVVTSISLVAFNTHFYDTFYSSNETAEQLDMSHDDLMKGTVHLLDYMNEKEDDLDVSVVVNGTSVAMYNQKEIDHMVDVLDLYRAAKSVQLVFYAFFVIMLVYWLVVARKTMLKDLFEASKLALGIIGVIMGSLLIMAVVDFNWFWTVFHQVLFDNELWLLNPQTDRLIVMVPLNFFKQLIFSIVLSWLVSLGLWFGGLALLNRRTRT